VAKCATFIILAVKPQDIIKVLEEIKPYSRAKLIISIAAGVKTILMEKILGRARVVRAMPNMPALVGKGITAITKGRFATKKDMNVARRIFLNIGEVVELEEGFMDDVTALSGSGPAYYFLFTEMLEKAGEALGLKKELARRLARATFIGAAASASAVDISMQDFVKKVASKGGTTEAALKIFEQEGMEDIVKKALHAARNRSCALSKNYTLRHC
jgi:pyrroline-5-carboxylate reductase